MDAKAVDLCLRRRSRSWPNCGRAFTRGKLQRNRAPSLLLPVIDEGETTILSPEDLQSYGQRCSSPSGTRNSSGRSVEECSEQPLKTQTESHPQIRVLCKSQGQFIEGIKGFPVYDGGQTRLLRIPVCPDIVSLKTALAKADMKAFDDAQNEMMIKCCLPSIPDKVVDIIDDDDVELLREEWKESRSSEPCPAGKLTFFVSWKGSSSSST